jgi:hypothetical protein
MAKAAPTETPKFMFERRSNVEAAHDWLLAGILTIDAPKAPMPRAKRYQRTVNDIVAALIAAAETDTMPTDGLTIGWQGDEPDIEDDALAAWRERSPTCEKTVTCWPRLGWLRPRTSRGQSGRRCTKFNRICGKRTAMD